MYKEKLIDLLKSDEEVKEVIYDSFYKCDYNLQERFIRMYCKNKGLFISFDNKNMYFQFRILLENNENGIYTIDFNNTKDFDNQPDEIYQKIYEALYNLIK